MKRLLVLTFVVLALGITPLAIAEENASECQQWLKISGSFASDRKAEIDQYQVEIAKLKVEKQDLQESVKKLQREKDDLKKQLPAKEEPKK